jgi:phosphate:Na+ symporter
MMALLLITPYTTLAEALSPHILTENAEISLVAFHTLFNTLGVLIALPFTKQFARFIKTIITTKGPKYTDRLDRRLLSEPTLAIEAARSALEEEFVALLHHILFLLGDQKEGHKADLHTLDIALEETQNYIDDIDLDQTQSDQWKQIIAFIHIYDHLQRLHERCDEESYRAKIAHESTDLMDIRQQLIDSIRAIISALYTKNIFDAHHIAKQNEDIITESMVPYRASIFEQMAYDQLDTYTGGYRLEAVRWLARVSHHLSHITLHMQAAVLEKTG